MAKIPSITSIFHKKDELNYTDNAFQLQYILSYSTILNSDCPETNVEFGQFTAYELTGWLIKKYPEFHDEFTNSSTHTMSEPNKIQAKLDGVEGKLKELTYLDLVEQEQEFRKGKIITIYRFTESGYLLAWIIESFEEKTREIANNQIYRILQRNASYDQSSFDLFGSLELKKYNERGIIDELFTSILRNTLSQPRRPIYTMRDLIIGSPLPNFNDEKHANLYLEIWHEAFQELPDDETRNYCLYWLKLGIEALMETTPPRNIKDFEELRYDLRNNYDMLALEGPCSNCHLPSAISIRIIEYMNRVSPSSDNFIVTKCTFCRQNCRIELPML
ncbi:MAG: hypothetical protein WBP64_04940 [Nitrososphaeraceae archaeon]